MSDSPLLVRGARITPEQQVRFSHPLNDRSEVWMKPFSRMVGLKRIGLTEVRGPPGKESFVYHTHHGEEEFLYVLAGRGIAEIDDAEYEVGAGDFMGFPTPSVGHHMRNPFDQDLVYLTGGEHRDMEIADFPRHGKCLVRDGEVARVADADALKPVEG